MARQTNGSQRIVTATELRRNFNEIARRLKRRREHAVVQKKGIPVAVILSLEEYEALVGRQKAMAAFYDFSRHLGREVEKLGLTEEEVLADIEITKREVFEERYGRLAK